MAEKKDKRILQIELDDNVKKVSITGLGDDETVVMKQELSEEELDQAAGGGATGIPSVSAGRGECEGVDPRNCTSKELYCSNNILSCPAQGLYDLFFCWSNKHKP